MPKAKGDPYFVSCRAGAEDAARELGVELIWDGPTGSRSRQAERGRRELDHARSRRDRGGGGEPRGISTVLRKARERGIKVVTWDADAAPDARDYFINQATPEGIGNTLTDEAARLLNNKGKFVIITGALSAANQNLWIDNIKRGSPSKYPELKLAHDPAQRRRSRQGILRDADGMKVYPDVNLIMDISAPAVPASAEAVKQSGRKDVKVIGLSLPNLCKRYVHEDIVQAVVLWNTHNLGYLTVHTGALLAANKLARGATSLQAGPLGTIEIQGDQIILGKPVIFNKANIDQFNF